MFAARFVWPVSLSPLYEIPARVTLLEPRFGLAVVAALVVTAVLIVLRRRWPGGLVAWTFSALMLAPLSVAVRKGAEMVPDRYSYLAGLGFAVLVGGAVLGVIRLVRRGALARSVAWVAAVASIATVAGFGTTSWSYSEVWRDSGTLWRWALEVDPACAVCHTNLGQSVLSGPGGESRAAEAEGLFRRAIALRPDLSQPYFQSGGCSSGPGTLRRSGDATAKLHGTHPGARHWPRTPRTPVLAPEAL